jgi:cytochrome P450
VYVPLFPLTFYALTPSAVALMRLVLQPYTFGDGTTVPPGTMVASPTWPHHLDGALYEDPRTFNPWRFVPLDAGAGAVPGDAEEEKRGESRKAFTTTDLQYIPFGHGVC